MFQFTLTVVFFHLMESRFGDEYMPFAIVLLLLATAIQACSPLLLPASDYFKTIDCQYWATRFTSPSRLLAVIIDARMLGTVIDGLGFTLGVVFVLLPVFGPAIIFFILLANLLVRAGTYCKFFHKNLPSEVKANTGYLLSACFFSVLANLFITFLYKLITYTRASIYIYGVGSAFVSKTNDDVNTTIAAISHNISQYIDEAGRTQPLLYFAILLASAIGACIFKRILIAIYSPEAGADITSGSQYVNDYEKKTLQFTDFSTLYKSLQRRYKPDWGHSRIEVYIPLEFWIFISINFATSRYVNNSWALATVAFLEIFLMGTALSRSITGHFKDIFEFGFELKSLRLIKTLSPSVPDALFNAKNKLLFLHVVGFNIILSAALLAQICLLKGQIYPWMLLIVLPVPLSLFASTWTLRPVYDAFRTVAKTNDSLLLDFHKVNLRNISGVNSFSKVTQTPLRLANFCVLLMMIFGTSFGFIHGEIWGTVFVVVLLALTFSLTLGCVGTFFEYIGLRASLRAFFCSRIFFTIIVLLAVSASFIAGIIHGIGLPQTMNPVHLGFVELLTHNCTILLITLGLGLISMGVGGLVLPCYTLYNLGGIIPGVVAAYGWRPLVTGVAPHAFFEISSFIIGALISFEIHRLLLAYQLRLPFALKKVVSTDIVLTGVSFILMTSAAIIESGVSHV